MWAIFWRIIKDRRTMLLIYCLLAIAILWMYIALFPSFKDQSANLEQLIKNYPESFMKAFNFDIKSFTTVEGYLATEQFSLMWPILVILLTLGFAGAAYAGEIEKGTIEILLSQPVSRIKIFLSRYLAGLSMLIIFVLVSIYATMPLSRIYDISFNAGSFNKMVLLSFMFGLAIFSLGMMFSAFLSDKGKVFFLTAGILILMYVANIVSSLKESLSNIKYASFFYYFNPSKALVHNQIDHWSYLVFFGVSIIAVIIGAIYFSKRDFTVS
jgi:ABC-2 type transport system permease protein